MDAKRIEQYNSTFKRLITNYKDTEIDFFRQKKGAKVSLYAGIYENKYSVAIESDESNIILKSTSLISVSQSDFNKSKAYIFSLNDSSLLSIFVTFVVDLESVIDEDNDASFNQIYNRYLFWVKMFKSTSQNISESKVLGLINELNEMIEILLPKFGIASTINSWIGPNMLHKDFAFEDGLWFELKAISVGKKKVTISSLEQLESDSVGYLIVTEYEKTSETNKEALNLFTLANKMNNLILNENLKEDLFGKIIGLGFGIGDLFDPNSELNRYKYIRTNSRKFVVNDVFPKLSRSNVVDAIVNVEYDLQLDLLNEFETDNWEDFK